MSESKITLEELIEGVELPTGAVHRRVLERIATLVWELDGACFNPGSAALLPAASDGQSSAAAGRPAWTPLHALAHAFALAEQHRDLSLLVVGHVERGETANGRQLSLQRARNVLALLEGERERFAATCEPHGVRDLQIILTWAARAHAFGCRPGAVDGELGAKTRTAIARFRRAYNYEFAGHLPVEGAWSKHDWLAVYDLYEASLCRLLGIKDGALGQSRRSLKFDSPASLGCDAHWPLARAACPGQRLAPDRRVELLFIEGETHGDLQNGSHGPPGWEIYAHALRFHRRMVPPPEPAPVDSFESDYALKQTRALAQRLTAGAFALWGRSVFGRELPRGAFEQLHADLRSGRLPNVELRVSALHRLGAYDSARRATLLQEALVVDAQADSLQASTLACVLLEEFGHYLDDLLRNRYTQVGGDAPADEGARFGHLLLAEQLGGPDRVSIGSCQTEGFRRDIEVDWRGIKQTVDDVLGPLQQASDDRQGSLEFSDAAPPAPRLRAEEASETLYLHLVLAGAPAADPHALVDLARKLHARWRGAAGAAVLFELERPGTPSPALERLLLSGLLRIYAALEQRLRAAALAADGLPDLGEDSWTLQPQPSLWHPGSPLAGVIDDITPFGEKQDWIARYSELDPDRAPRERRVRERALAPPAEPGERNGFDPREVTSARGHLPDAGAIARPGPADTRLDDALNTVDRGLGAADTVLSILELVGVEVTGSAGVALAGPVLGIVTFLRGLLIADDQQREAAKGIGMVFAYFGIAAAARAPEGPPPRMTRARVEEEVRRDPWLAALRERQQAFRGNTPEAVLSGGIAEGIDLVIDALNANLDLEADRTQRAFEQMRLRARIDRLDESKLSSTYTLAWWRTEIRKRTYGEFIAGIEAPALAVYHRFQVNARKTHEP